MATMTEEVARKLREQARCWGVSEATLIEHALALGQDQRLLEQIQRGELHPAMAAFGLWRDEDALASLVEEIIENRQNQPVRPAVEF